MLRAHVTAAMGSGDVTSGDQVNGGGYEYSGALSDLAQPPDPSCRVDGGILQGSFYPINPNATAAPAPPPFPPGDLPGIRVHPTSTGSGVDALVRGTIEVSNSCVWLVDTNGSRYAVVWPANTFGRTNPVEIVLPDGEIARPGDTVEGSGGYLDAASATEGAGLNQFADECVLSGEAAVFNSGSSIEIVEAG